MNAMNRPADLVCLGEPLVELNESGREGEALMAPGFGGDVSNVAIAAARQGARTAMLTHLGDDIFARRFRTFWDVEGVDHSNVATRAGAATGLYFVTHEAGSHAFSYMRASSAASQYSASDLPERVIAGAGVLHVSGISQAISNSCCDAVFAAMEMARNHSTIVSYDTNLRLKLWPLPRARAIIAAGLRMADVARPSVDDARLLFGVDEPDAIADFILALGPKIVALTLGPAGCLVATSARREIVPGLAVAAVDATGAGDAFTGAFLAQYLRCNDAFAAARYANVAAALQTRGIGAVAPIPRRPEVESYLQ